MLCEPVWGSGAHAEPDLGAMDPVYVDDMKKKDHVTVTGGVGARVSVMS